MKKQIKDRIIGYILLTVMYIVAFFTGLLVYDMFEIHLLLKVLFI